MAISRIDALVLRAADLDTTAAFYRAVGLVLEDEDHGDGPVHLACDFGGAHFAIFQADEPGSAPAGDRGGATLFGFRVDDVDATAAAAVAAGGTLLREPGDYPWGRRAVVADPDGRPVEFNGPPPASR